MTSHIERCGDALGKQRSDSDARKSLWVNVLQRFALATSFGARAGWFRWSC
jgi:hypothetical protein